MLSGGRGSWLTAWRALLCRFRTDHLSATPSSAAITSAPTSPLLPQTQFHPPTGVTHCADAWFTRPAAAGSGSGSGDHSAATTNTTADTSSSSAAAPDLIVIRATRLEVYTPRFPPGSRAEGPLEACGLQLLGGFPLYGVVEGVAVLRGRAAAGQRDAVMLSFRWGGI